MAIVKISDLPLVDSPVEGTDLFVVVQDNVTKKAYASDIQTYVGFEEIQYATAGQTVFNLTTMTYAAGANNLQVFVDGVNQYEGLSYIETDNNTVTFTQGLHVGAVVKFSTVQTQTAQVASAGAVTFLQAGTGAIPRSVQDKERDIVSVKDFGAVGDGVTNDTAAIQAAEDACAASGQALWFPAGTYRCNTGITKKSVNWFGAGKYKSKLAYYGNSTFINATGTSPDRRLFTISDMELNGTNAGAAAVGITLGWNQRSTPLVRVHIFNFGHYGIHFNDENWIVDFYDVEVDTCGRSTNNSAGIYKTEAIDAGTWNAISFYNLIVEACGTASSAAGGINLPTANANRGLYFYSPCVEGNFGTAEIYVTNMGDCHFVNLYMEVVSAQATNAVELSGVQGGFTGGYITGDDNVANLVGVKIRPGSAFVSNRIEFDKVLITNFASSVDAESAIIWTNQVNGDRIFANPSGNAQFFGDYAPRVSAYKSSAQSVNSGAFTKVAFETEVYDLTGAFASSTFTPNAIGTYQIDANVNWLAAVDQDRLIISIYLNGSANKSSVFRASGTGEQSVNISGQIRTTAVTDTIEIYVRQDSGSPQDISATATETYFMASLIGRTA
jgi:hypothetical protein